MGNKIYSNEDLEQLLSTPVSSEFNLDEDLMIDQGDGTKACLNWELRNRGDYSLLDLEKEERMYKKLENMSDEELLRDAYLAIGIKYSP